MVKATLLRFDSSEQGTFGLLQAKGFSCFISELPDNNNIKQFSCIPAGIYECKWHKSPKFGWCYRLQNVPSRSEILIHKGNFVGDSRKGYKANSHGCLLPAKKLGKMAGQKAGLMSLIATQDLYSFFNQQTFELEIKNAYLSNSSS